MEDKLHDMITEFECLWSSRTLGLRCKMYEILRIELNACI
jgi:hypothetical protein